ncbi:DNA methyltransferase, partial [Escherichia coli]
MSRFVLGNCIDVMARIPDNAIDFILTDPPYLVGFRDRQGRTIAGDKTDEWLQPACNEMYRVLKKDALMVSFYGWNRVDRFMSAWKNAGFSVVGHLVFTKNYTSKAAYVGYRHECAYKGDENMYCTVKEIIREVLDTDVPDSECVFAVVLTRGDVRHIAQDWNL